MQLTEWIPRRRSVRNYLPDAVAPEVLAELTAFIAGLAPLVPGARVESRILPASACSFLQKWATPHVLAIFAEDTEDAMLNVGFLYQQVDLWLQAQGLGSCWVGLGRMKDASAIPEGMTLAVLMPFGHPNGVPLRIGPADFNRKALENISDTPDARLEPARIAPSATNSQPWAFTHVGDAVRVWREKPGIIRQRTVGRWSPLDVGIALAHLALSAGERFSFRREEEPPLREGFLYVGTITL